MFLHGCNYPWSTDGHTIFYGLDFGANVWGSHLGVSTRRADVAADFAKMAALGFVVARWFVFCDGRAGILYDDGGLPVGPMRTSSTTSMPRCRSRAAPASGWFSYCSTTAGCSTAYATPSRTP